MTRVARLGLLVGLLNAASSLLAGGVEAQSLDACSNIHVEAGANCEVRPPKANCEAMCTPISVQAACAAEAYVNCDAMCDIDIQAGCTATCQAGCTGSCTGSPGSFDCEAYCQGDCSASCTGKCGSGDSRCAASCEATCTGDCNASCEIQRPMLDCQADCNASCQGSCEAKANIDCQAQCQSKFYVDCEVDLQGGCEVDCKTEKGALFCDGAYVRTTNLDECVEALKNRFKVKVTYYSSSTGEAMSMCNGSVCTASAGGTAKAGASCSALPGAAGGGASWLLVVAGLAGYVVRRRRR
jgi:MYXO-CTERM domain-containing protein